jgi:hypothetical protein
MNEFVEALIGVAPGPSGLNYVFIVVTCFTLSCFYFAHDADTSQTAIAQRYYGVWIACTALTWWIAFRFITHVDSDKLMQYRLLMFTTGPAFLLLVFFFAAAPLAQHRRGSRVLLAFRDLVLCIAIAVLGAGLFWLSLWAIVMSGAVCLMHCA